MPRSNKPFRIAMIPTANGGVNYYRMAAWAFEMRKYKNVEVALFEFQYAMNEMHPWQKYLPINPAVGHSIDRLHAAADLVIWQPVHYEHTLDFFSKMRQKHGKPMLIETDDNFIDVPPWNEAFHSFGPNSHNRYIATEAMKMADGMIVTTPHLKEIYSPFNDNIHIVENSLDFKGDRKFVGWDTVSVRKHSGLRLGWIGGRSHFDDLMMVAPMLQEVLRTNPNVTLCFVNSAIKASCQALNRPYPFEGFKNVHYADRSVPINRYAAFMAHFAFDIGIAPLVDCNFNRSKSNLRWLEYSALGIPAVCSKVGHYTATVKNGVDGLLVSNLSEWRTALDGLIRLESFRKEIGRACHRRVRKDFNVKRNAAKYVRLLKQLADFKPDREEEEWIKQPLTL